jgi:hypothetical protein
MPSFRQLVSSGSPLEPEIGLSRAVRAGSYVCVAGTAPIAEGGGADTLTFNICNRPTRTGWRLDAAGRSSRRRR